MMEKEFYTISLSHAFPESMVFSQKAVLIYVS